MKKRKGFTLLELLVVIAIIIMLVALLAPNLRGMRRAANTVLCANNLKRIGEAIVGRLNVGRKVQKLTPYGWPSEISTYLGTSDVLACPEAGEMPEGGGVHRPISDFIRIAYYPAYTSTREFVESGIMCKASKAQFLKYGGNMKRVWASHEGYIDDYSGTIYWGYEDQGVGGDDYQDVLVKATQFPDGRSELECRSETAGKPCIQHKETGEILVGYLEYNWRHGPNSVKTIYLNTGSGSGGSNYAINAHNAGINKIGKILVMDYIWTIARSADEWTNEDFDSDDNDRPDFARHAGKLNVLFPGGSVKLMRPDDVDPATAGIEGTYWLP